MDLETVVFSPDVAKGRLIWNSDNPKVCVVSRLLSDWGQLSS